MSEAARRAVKIASFAWLSLIYLVIAIVATLIADKFTYSFDEREEDKKSTGKLFLEFLVYVWYLTIVAYAGRVIVNNVPFPFDGVAGFSYISTREKNAFPLFGAMLVAFSKTWRDKTAYMLDRIGGRNRPG